MDRVIEKKSWPQQFEAVKNGQRTFDLRLADFEAKEGDTLLLREWDPEKKSYTGRELKKKVGYVMKFDSKNLSFYSKEELEQHGLQIISLK